MADGDICRSSPKPATDACLPEGSSTTTEKVDSDSDSEIEIPIPEWGSSDEDEEGGWAEQSDSERAPTPPQSERRGLVVAVVTDTALDADAQLLASIERAIRMVSWDALLYWGSESGWTATEGGHQSTLLLSAVTGAVPSAQDSAGARDVPPDAVREICAIDHVVSVATWACGPCPIPVTVHEAAELTTCKANIPDFLRSFGMAFVPDALPSMLVSTLRQRVCDRIGEAERAMAKAHGGIALGEDEFAFFEMASRGRHRYDLLLELNRSELLEIDGGWRRQVAEALDCDAEKLRVQVSAVYSRPGAPDQDWHSDGGHLDRDGGWGSGEPGDDLTPSPPYAVCVFVPLVDLTPETGYTSFWPRSHRHAGLLGFGPAATAFGAEVNGVVKAGTAVVYDYRLLHRGRANTGSTQRELLQFLYSRDYVEAKNYGKTRLLS